MNSRLLITLLCAGAVALACGSLTRNESASVQDASDAQPQQAVSTPRAKQTGKLNSAFAVTIEPRALRFALNLTNETAKQLELSFPNGQQYEFTVLDSGGREVYRWGQGRMFTQSVQNKLLGRDDTLQIDERAVTTLPQGKYVAVATLRSTNHPVRQVSEFELR